MHPSCVFVQESFRRQQYPIVSHARARVQPALGNKLRLFVGFRHGADEDERFGARIAELVDVARRHEGEIAGGQRIQAALGVDQGALAADDVVDVLDIVAVVRRVPAGRHGEHAEREVGAPSALPTTSCLVMSRTPSMLTAVWGTSASLRMIMTVPPDGAHGARAFQDTRRRGAAHG